MTKTIPKLLIVGMLLAGNHALSLAEPTKAVQTSAGVSVAKRLVTAARQMISHFKDTHYSHRTLIDRDRGICDVDCSGFLVALLRQTSPQHLQQIATHHKRALAEDFYTTFSQTDGKRPAGWQPVKRLQDVEPGDVIAWLKQERHPGDNTGHVMLVERKPTAESPNLFQVRVLDSTAHGHGSDSRIDGKSGIGGGTLWLDVDTDGRPIGYRWKSRRGMLHQAPIAIGRAIGEAGVSNQ